MLFLFTLFAITKSEDLDSLIDQISSLQTTVSELTTYVEREIFIDTLSNLHQSLNILKEEIEGLYMPIIQAKYSQFPTSTFHRSNSYSSNLLNSFIDPRLGTTHKPTRTSNCSGFYNSYSSNLPNHQFRHLHAALKKIDFYQKISDSNLFVV